MESPCPVITKTPTRAIGSDVVDADGELLFVGSLGSLYTREQDEARAEFVAACLNREDGVKLAIEREN